MHMLDEQDEDASVSLLLRGVVFPNLIFFSFGESAKTSLFSFEFINAHSESVEWDPRAETSNGGKSFYGKKMVIVRN